MLQIALEAHERLKRAFTPELRALSVYELVIRIEASARFISLIAAAVLQANGESAAKLGRSPGLGEWIGYLRRAVIQLRTIETASARSVAELVNEALIGFDQGVRAGPPDLRAIKPLRDHLLHGGTLPASEGDAVRAALTRVTQLISDSICRTLDESTLTMDAQNGLTDHHMMLSWAPREPVPLWPFVFARLHAPNEVVIYAFASYARELPTYLVIDPAGGRWQTKPTDEALRAALSSALVASRPDQKFEVFANDVQRDLAGFSEAESEPLRQDDDGGFEYIWERATSEGAEPRRDRFRLGDSDAREWHSLNRRWVTYTSYLRSLANWQIVGMRLRQELARIENDIDREERASLGWKLTGIATQPATLDVRAIDSQTPEERQFEDLFQSVDEALGSNRGSTSVVFINGEAGIGKTRAMLQAARKRASEVENGKELPLFLYVRSAGHVLESLDTVVAAAVSTTRNLTQEAVRALCRNGQMTLLIDGFDELLGGVGYTDAISSLRPWLRSLGGRGVLVLSARSSYYLDRYRASLQRAQLDPELTVSHQIADVRRWTPPQVATFLEACGVDSAEVEALGEADRKLLGLPFFARAFAEMSRAGRKPGDSLTEQLLNSYLEREARKLAVDEMASNALLDRVELRELFHLLAEEMASKEEREASVEELEFLAAVVTDDETLQTRPHLKQRLSVLCGLASGGEATSRRFRFQHEIFFDEFLAGAVVRHVRASDTAAFARMLRASQWRMATAKSAVAQLGSEKVVALLEGHTGAAYTGQEAAPIEAINLGAMWTAVVNATDSGSFTIIGSRFTDELDLSTALGVQATLRDCRLSSLRLPGGSQWQITLVNTLVRELAIEGDSLRGLIGVRHLEIARMTTATSYHDRSAEILKQLTKLGADVADRPTENEAVTPRAAEAARWFLNRMDSYGEFKVVLRKKDLQPAEGNESKQRWATEYGPDVWKAFMRALMDNSLAQTEKFDSQGEAKVRMRLQATTQALLGLEASPDRADAIANFWQHLER